MMTPKRQFLSFVFTCLCLNKPLLIQNNWTDIETTFCLKSGKTPKSPVSLCLLCIIV